MKSDLHRIVVDHDPFDQQPHKPLLLWRKQRLPNLIQPAHRHHDYRLIQSSLRGLRRRDEVIHTCQTELAALEIGGDIEVADSAIDDETEQAAAVGNFVATGSGFAARLSRRRPRGSAGVADSADRGQQARRVTGLLRNGIALIVPLCFPTSRGCFLLS